MAKHDLVIRNGTVVDGTGKPMSVANVAVDDGKISAIGGHVGRGREEIDARDKLVTPGFVDIHTHYDGQITWGHTLVPSSNHGVTTVVGGNCGVGFAPCRPTDRNRLIALMEGVEDIPQAVMAEGIPWHWETFPEYLDFVAERSFDADVAMHVPHSPLRVYVMGDRGINHEPSTDADRDAMARIVTESIRAGAIGVSTSRSLSHRANDGKPAPSVDAAEQEVLALARGLRDASAGVFQIVTAFGARPDEEMRLVDAVSQVATRNVSFTLLEVPYAPEDWRKMLGAVDKMRAAGQPVRAQVAPRPVGMLMGLDLSLSPFSTRPSYAKIAHLSLQERVAILRQLEFKQQLLAEEHVPSTQPLANMMMQWIDKLTLLDDPPNYFPPADAQLGSRAARQGTTALALAYDLMLEQDGHAILYMPSSNYSSRTPGPVFEMMRHPDTLVALGDGGAHYGFICDAGYPTFVLTYWARDAEPAYRFSIEWAVNALARAPAEAVGLTDRGLVAVGYKADLNVIDYDNLKLGRPVTKYDLPAGGRRLWQPSTGYQATIVSGVVAQSDDHPTGALPGRLVRGTGYRLQT